MLATTEQENNYNDMCINTFGMKPDDVINLINKQKKKTENQKYSSMKYYYGKIKENDELHQRKLECNRRYYHNNKERLNEYSKNRLENDEIKEKYKQHRKEHYEANKEQVLEKSRERYFEKNKDKIKLKRGRKPKTKTPLPLDTDDETTASDGDNSNKSSD